MSAHEPDPSEGTPPQPAGDDARWQRELLNRLAFASLAEQRRARRWNSAFKFGILLYLFALLVVYLPRDWWESGEGERHSALVEVRGLIADQGDASADRIIGGLRAAFEDERTAGVIMRINSPGGSPVQASYINDEVKRLREAHPDIPLYAVIADIGASGGYYVAASADKIFANRSSIVGSIGVLMNGFGFVEAMDKLGVERRLMTAGEHKGFLDPFSPTRPEEVDHLNTLLRQIHQQFIAAVKEGRGERLSDAPDLFSGLMWTGEESLDLGLVDALGNSSYVAREVIGADNIVDFTPGRSYLDLIADRIGASVARSLATELGLLGPRIQ